MRRYRFNGQSTAYGTKWTAFWRRLLASLALLFVFSDTATAESSQWTAVKDISIEVTGPDNPLDFSGLAKPGAAGRYGWAVATAQGHIAFELQKEPSRFLCASFALSSLTGGLPKKQDVPRLVAALRSGAYNLVRMHFVDAHLMAGRKNDFEFDPDQLDRLYFLLAQLKQAGIYWIVDGLTSDNAGFGDVNPNRYVQKHDAKLDLLTSEEGFAHWASLVEKLWGRTNPYTGIPPMADPAMLGMILVNEGGVSFLATTKGGRYPEKLGPLFAEWLKQRYSDDKALRKAWGIELEPGDSLLGRIELPRELRGRGKRDLDFARFVVELESAAVKRMHGHVRKLGFKGLTTAFNNWGFIQSDISRNASDWIDMHSYHTLPSNHGQVGSTTVQTSVHSNVARYIRELTNARQWGKPFTVSEYGQPFWNQWRHESALLLSAVAAHQDWDAICQFAEFPIQFDYSPTPFRRLQAIYPFGVGGDPVARATERLAALLFLRGDVATAKARVRLHVNGDKSLQRNGGWDQVPESISRMGLVSAIGLDFSTMPTKPRERELSFDLNEQGPTWLRQLESTLLKSGGEILTKEPAVLADKGLVSASNQTSFRERRFQFDTGQLLLDSVTKRITLLTDRTVATALQTGGANLGAFQVLNTSGPAMIALSSLDGKPLGESTRMLLFVVTDAQNTGMSFDDASRTRLKHLGTHPPMLSTVAVQMAFNGQHAANLKVWPLSLAGKRREALAVQHVGGNLLVNVDTAALPDGPAIYFELAVVGN